MDAATKMMMARANPGMAAQAYAGVEYLPVNVYYPHDSTAEKEGTLNVKIGDAWAPRKCAVRGNFLFIFSPSRENEKEALLEQENMESVSLQESTTGKKKPPNKKEQKTTTYVCVPPHLKNACDKPRRIQHVVCERTEARLNVTTTSSVL